jgi:DNA-binding response OmpR family regulator
LKALVVDDEEDVRVLVAHIIATSGTRVAMAANPDEARTLAVQHELDLLVTDIEMGGQPAGIELACDLRAARPTLAVIYMSGKDGWTGLVPGGTLLQKPFSAADLLLAVDSVLRRRGQGQ